MGSLACFRVLGTSALAGSKERSPPVKYYPTAGGKGRSAQWLASVPVPFPVFTIRNRVGFLLPALFFPLFFPPFPLQETMWMVARRSREVRRAGEGAILLQRLARRKDAVQIRGASAIKWRVWATAVEARVGGSAEGAQQGANPIVQGTQAASEAPGDILEATVLRTMESRQLPHGQRAPMQPHPQAPSFSFPESPGEAGAACGTGAQQQCVEEH